MNKQELIDAVATQTESSKAAATRAVDALLDNIKKGVKKEGKVQIVGFGTFSLKKRNPRTGRNPATGETIQIKASKTVGFKPGADFKSKL